MPLLRYNARPEPLLKVVRNQQRVVRKPEEDVADSKASTFSRSRGALKSDIEPVSDSESPRPRAQFQKPSDLSSDDSEDDRTQRGAISQTKFGPSTATKNSTASSKKTPAQSISTASTSAEGTNQRALAKRRKLHDDGLGSRDGEQRKVLNSSQQSRTSEVPSSSGEHLMGGDGFVRKHKLKATYSKCPKASTSLARKFNPERSFSDKGKQKASSKNFKQVPSTDENDEATPRGSKTFRSISKSASRSPSPVKSKKTPFKFLKDSDISDAEPPTRNRKKSRSTPPEDMTPKAVFKAIPATQHMAGTDPGYIDDYDMDESLSEIGSEDENAETNEEPGLSVSQESPCPWCGESVSKTMLDEFSKGARMSVQQQTRFCRKHKKQAAKDSWDAKSYPAIDWTELPSRIKAHYHYLTEIVDGEPSHFRAELAKQIEEGKARSLQKEVNLNPGYYGPRGFNLMCDILVGKFTKLLKEKAVHDKVIAGRGSAAFIQVVLIPELAVQLIMEDMGVPIEEARDIMEESKALGEIVHEEI